MGFIKKLWKNRPDTSTPLNAQGLNDLEERVQNGFNTVSEDFDARVQAIDTEILNMKDSIIIIESTLPTNGTSKIVGTPNTFNNDYYVISMKFQNANSVWLDLSGDHSASYGIKASIVNNSLYFYNDTSWANGKRAKVVLLKST